MIEVETQPVRGDAWITVGDGDQFWPFDPYPEEVDLRHVAHSLAWTFRYRGHTKRPWSVAQHSLAMVQWLEENGYDRDSQRWALIHDAAEAYLGDISKPVKHLFRGFDTVEKRCLSVICQAVGVDTECPEIVYDIDKRIALNEKNVLIEQGPGWHKDWGLGRAIPHLDDRIEELLELDPIEIEFLFVVVARALGLRRGVGLDWNGP